MEAVGLKLRWRMKHVQSAKLRGRSSMVVNFWIGEFRIVLHRYSRYLSR